TMGEQKGMEYLKQFAAQEPVFIPASQRVVLDKVIEGDYPLAVMTFNHHSTISAAQGAPVDWIRMQPLSESINLIGIVEGAPHPNAARLLEEYILSDEGQKILADNDYLPASPAVPAKAVELKPDAGHFTVNVVTPQMARDDLPKWTALYRELFR
ncbi:MAG: ABC transporter substrate-binding protein, partial [Nevskiales bacterium]